MQQKDRYCSIIKGNFNLFYDNSKAPYILLFTRRFKVKKII